MVITLTRKGKMEMKKNDQIFQSMIATLLWKGTHILRHGKKKKKLRNSYCLGIYASLNLPSSFSLYIKYIR